MVCVYNWDEVTHCSTKELMVVVISPAFILWFCFLFLFYHLIFSPSSPSSCPWKLSGFSPILVISCPLPHFLLCFLFPLPSPVHPQLSSSVLGFCNLLLPCILSFVLLLSYVYLYVFYKPQNAFPSFWFKEAIIFKEILKSLLYLSFLDLSFPILVRNCEARDQSLSCIDFISLCTLCHV